MRSRLLSMPPCAGVTTRPQPRRRRRTPMCPIHNGKTPGANVSASPPPPPFANRTDYLAIVSSNFKMCEISKLELTHLK